MTGKYPFPDDIRDPNRKDPNPFAGEDPALDPEPASSDEPYAVGDLASQYKPEYEAVISDRATMCLVGGTIGLLASLSGWLALRGGDFFLLVMMPLFSLAGSLPALLLSLSDLGAMRHGAMQSERRNIARAAFFLGVCGLLSSILFLTYQLWYAWYMGW